MKKNPLMPLVIVGCVSLALAACDQKTAASDPTKDRQMQEMQAKIDALSAQSSELNRQLADREAAEVDAKRSAIEKEQANLEQQRADLEAERRALAAATPVSQPQTEVTSSTNTAENDPEPVYQGKPATYDIFYSKLQEDGDWLDSEEYGYIWRPSVSTRNREWRPYSDGRWVETERGWTWDSNERFGWATYHYGRWINLNNSGWCWIPGDEWAPAWVSWRSNDQYVGWAPLPPEARISRGGSINASIDVGYDTGPGFYNFVDTEYFGEETYLGRLVPQEQNVVIINETVNVTNITYVDRSIHNYGPDFDRISRRSRHPIDRYQLALDRSSQFDRDATVPRPRGDRLAVVAPVLVANGRGNSEVRPVKVEKKIVKADRDKGWRGVQPDQRQAVQADLQKQANRQAQNQQTQREQQRLQKARQDAQAARNQAATRTRPTATEARKPMAPVVRPDATPTAANPTVSTAERGVTVLPSVTPSAAQRPLDRNKPRVPREPQARPIVQNTPRVNPVVRPQVTPAAPVTPNEPPAQVAPEESAAQSPEATPPEVVQPQRQVQRPNPADARKATDASRPQRESATRQAGESDVNNRRETAQKAEQQARAQVEQQRQQQAAQAARQRDLAQKAEQQARAQAEQQRRQQEQQTAQAQRAAQAQRDAQTEQAAQAQREARRQQAEQQQQTAPREAAARQSQPRSSEENPARREAQRQQTQPETKRSKSDTKTDNPDNADDPSPRSRRP